MEALYQILPTILGAGGLIGYLFERRKNKAEAGSKELDNAAKLVEMYKEALEDFPKRYELKYQETVGLWEKKVKILTEEIQLLESSYLRKIKLLESEIKLKSKHILSLKRELKEKENEAKQLIQKLKDAVNNSK